MFLQYVNNGQNMLDNSLLENGVVGKHVFVDVEMVFLNNCCCWESFGIILLGIKF